jgi:hypothetical protein
LCCLKTRISSRITSISSSEYKKSPVRGRIIIINGTSTELWMALRRPRLGVVPPPTLRFPQTSSLSAPPRTALRKDQSGLKCARYEQLERRSNRVDADFDAERRV